jgi:hypothetical protein
MNTQSFVILGIIIIIAVLAMGCTKEPSNISTSTILPTSIPTAFSDTKTSITPSKQPTTQETTSGQMSTSTTLSNSIAFTSVPPVGGYNLLKGKVKAADPSKFKVVVYIYVTGWWGPKPQWDNPYSEIKSDGTWSTNIVTGGSDTQATKIIAFLVPADYKPPNMKGEQQLPSDLGQFISAKVER